MVLKIAILTEKYASSYKWYVDTILQLISSAGTCWDRCGTCGTDCNEHGGSQEYAAKVIFEHLKSPQRMRAC